eukprot:GHVU01228122.1.p2 GENE.GHVU01228122.1~~GHVU01228122.1.p2  ORF type:complete len:162 (-),score=16.17 GHVU01228122.1:276-761(-)
MMKGGRERGREGGREGGRERGREREREMKSHLGSLLSGYGAPESLVMQLIDKLSATIDPEANASSWSEADLQHVVRRSAPAAQKHIPSFPYSLRSFPPWLRNSCVRVFVTGRRLYQWGGVPVSLFVVPGLTPQFRYIPGLLRLSSCLPAFPLLPSHIPLLL